MAALGEETLHRHLLPLGERPQLRGQLSEGGGVDGEFRLPLGPGLVLFGEVLEPQGDAFEPGPSRARWAERMN